MIGKKIAIGAATGGAGAGLWWAGITPAGESVIHPVPIVGGIIAGALVGAIGHDTWYKTGAAALIAGVGGGAIAQYAKLRWFAG